jgi:hypothetical protein
MQDEVDENNIGTAKTGAEWDGANEQRTAGDPEPKPEPKPEPAKGHEYEAPMPATLCAIEDMPTPPPLCHIGEPAVLRMLPEFGGDTIVELVLTGRFGKVTTPLSLVPLTTLSAEEVVRSQSAVRAANAHNQAAHRHNLYICGLLSSFALKHRCGSSAGRLTVPELPPDYEHERVDAIAKLRKDANALALQAIAYLGEHGRYAVKDYPLDQAVRKADDVAFDSEIARMQQTGRVRVHGSGGAPSWWNGRASKDDAGNVVGWKRGEAHIFLAPDVRPLVLVSAAQLEDEAKRTNRLRLAQAACSGLLIEPAASANT